jgi:hypothetical protein
LGERSRRYWRGELRRGPSRSKDALRMTARTDNGKSKCKSEMRGFFAALRMTNKEQTTAKCGGPSTAQRTMRPSAAPVGMTDSVVLRLGRDDGLSDASLWSRRRSFAVSGVRRICGGGVYGCRFSTGAGVFAGAGGFAFFCGSMLGSLMERWTKTGIAAWQSEFELKGTNGKVTCDRGIAGEGEDDQ